MATFERIDPDGDIAVALQGIRHRLDTLASINAWMKQGRQRSPRR
jgi:hypothetical protein